MVGWDFLNARPVGLSPDSPGRKELDMRNMFRKLKGWLSQIWEKILALLGSQQEGEPAEARLAPPECSKDPVTLQDREQVCVMSRGRSHDYSFLGDCPKDRWWRRFGEYTSFEQPTVLVEGNGLCWRAYVTGIEGRRRDSHHRAIRYSVAFEGSCEKNVLGQRAWGFLASYLLGSQRVAEALDDAFTEEAVEEIFHLGVASDWQPRVEDLMEGVLCQDFEPEGSELSDQVRRILEGKEFGLIAELNLLGDEGPGVFANYPRRVTLIRPRLRA